MVIQQYAIQRFKFTLFPVQVKYGNSGLRGVGQGIYKFRKFESCLIEVLENHQRIPLNIQRFIIIYITFSI